jgi:predicted RNase H-like HicB family nuclease
MDEEPPKMKITVSALWDAEARVWVATSEDVPGLATEAPTVEALRAKIETMIPELLELNDGRNVCDPVVPLTMMYEEHRTLRIA